MRSEETTSTKRTRAFLEPIERQLDVFSTAEFSRNLKGIRKRSMLLTGKPEEMGDASNAAFAKATTRYKPATVRVGGLAISAQARLYWSTVSEVAGCGFNLSTVGLL